MSWKSTKAGYGWLSIVLHWLMLLLIVAVYATMDLKSIFPKRSPSREAMAIWHYMLGLSVFFLVWLSAKGPSVPFFGMELAALIGKSEELAKWFKDIHEGAATVGYFLVGSHAAAALYHHYVKRDNTLRLMLFCR